MPLAIALAHNLLLDSILILLLDSILVLLLDPLFFLLLSPQGAATQPPRGGEFEKAPQHWASVRHNNAGFGTAAVAPSSLLDTAVDLFDTSPGKPPPLLPLPLQSFDAPVQITSAMGEEYRRRMRMFVPFGDKNKFYPQVFITYATGNRKGIDDVGCGPGMVYAVAIAERLEAAGIKCFSGVYLLLAAPIFFCNSTMLPGPPLIPWPLSRAYCRDARV